MGFLCIQVADVLMVRCALERGYKCLYVVPFVSIALEKAKSLQVYSRVGLRVGHAVSNSKVCVGRMLCFW
jgi:replicative superfamily II helicase